MRSITSCTSGTWLPDRIDRPMTCDALVDRGAHDLRRRQADALVDDFHADVAGAHGDLLGAVGVAVEARLADQELEAPAELGGQLVDRGAHAVERRAVAGDGRLRDAGRCAVFAEHPAQRRAPFAGRHAGAGGLDRRLHDVAAFLGGRFKVGDGSLHALVVALRRAKP